MRSRPALKVTDLPLPTRTLNTLEAAGVETLAELSAKRPDELLAIPSFGVGQLGTVRSALAEVGQELAPLLPPPLISARQAGQRKRRQQERAMRRREPRDREAVIASWVRLRRGTG